MRLRATRPMTVQLPALSLTIEVMQGEELRTEVSAKFRRDSLTRELTDAGFAVQHWWTDPDERFGLVLAQVVDPMSGSSAVRLPLR